MQSITLIRYTILLQSMVVRNRFSLSQISLISSLSKIIALPQLIATPARPHSTTLLKVLIPMVGRSVFMLWPTLHIFTRTGFVLHFNLYPPHLRISSSVPSALCQTRIDFIVATAQNIRDNLVCTDNFDTNVMQQSLRRREQ